MKKLIISALLIAIVAGFFIYRSNRAPQYRFYELKETRLVESVYASGYIDSRKAVVVKSEVSGIVKELLVKEGDTVEKGQLLAVIKNDALDANLSEIKAQIDLLRQRLKEDSDFLTDLKNLISIKRAIYDNAEANLNRKKPLFEEGLLAKRDLDDAVRDLEIARRDLKRHEGILADTLQSLQSQYKALLAKERAIIAEINRHQVRSPITGKVTRRFIKEGDYVNTLNQTNEIFAVANTNQIETVLLIDEENVPYIREGMKVLVSSDSFKNEVFEGKVISIETQSDRTSRLVKAWATVDYKDKPIVLNMTVEANIVTKEVTGLFIPIEAYHDGFVNILQDSAKKSTKVEVDKTPIKGHLRVLSGLKEGQRVIVK